METLIIGAGPAGLQLGYCLERAGRDYLILEAGAEPGTSFRQYPRHGQLISINKPHTGTTDPELNLRMDWNSLLSDDPELLFTRYTPRYFPPASEMVRYLADFARSWNLRIQHDTRVTRIERDGDFVVTDDRGRTYRAERLVVATGVPTPNVPVIPGIETAELYADVSVDPQDFADQRVLIVGKGNSAFETADGLMETAAVIHVAGPSPVRFAWRTHYVGHLRAVNNNMLDSYQLKSQNAVLDGSIVGIEHDGASYRVTFSFSRAGEVKKDLQYDRVILCTGFRFDHSIFADDCRPELVVHDRFPAQTAEWESVNIPGLYFAGTLMQARSYKKSTCGFIHGFRYGVRALHRILEAKYHGAPWPHRELGSAPQAMMQAVIERVNRTSALWQQFGVLCDVIELRPDGSARYHEEMPVDYAHEVGFGQSGCYFVVTLEYGPHHDQVDPFDITVGRIAQDDAVRSEEGQYLHPVVRSYDRRALVSTHHVTENLENEWNREMHCRPLEAFLAREVARSHVDAAA